MELPSERVQKLLCWFANHSQNGEVVDLDYEDYFEPDTDTMGPTTIIDK